MTLRRATKRPTFHKRGRGAHLLGGVLLAITPGVCLALGGGDYVTFTSVKGAFPVARAGAPSTLWASSRDYPGVLRVVRLFRNDLERVTGRAPALVLDSMASGNAVIIAGTLGRNPVIDRLVAAHSLDVSDVARKWEVFLVQEVAHPLPGVARALVIAGSDRRGTMYGMLDISKKMGVSPWYWWADVPVKHHADIFIVPGRHTAGPPSVRFRGVFLNDEWPDLTNWVIATYSEVPPSADPPVPHGIARYGHEFYEHVFELLLRLKANYLWPAMWNNAFNEDDPRNPELADEYGIVMGTSHQEPMLRAQKEWDRRYLRSLGPWNYALYPDTMQAFWRAGIQRNRKYESVVTIGLRGSNDTPMAPGGPEVNRNLLEEIVGVQRKILAQEVNPDLSRVPQIWCLYKEVVEYYDAGMRVPEDVTLLWPDDNWGNLRRLPTPDERARTGGAGIYYHFDYHGGPRSYQWINTNPIPKIWDQMSLAADAGANRTWIVNAGHLKGYELPIEYFMDLAWDRTSWRNDNTGEYMTLWAARQFGTEHAREIADILARYTRYNGRRKPELLSPETYSLVNYDEAERVVADYRSVADRAAAIEKKLPLGARDAFYELVRFPAKASALINELYLAAGKNALYARQRRASTNDEAARTQMLFREDTALMGRFNLQLAGGKWNHFMDQPHLGYTAWRDPPENSLRAIPLVEMDVPNSPALGVAVEGSESAWPGGTAEPALPPIDRFGADRRSIEIFNRGKTEFNFTVRTDSPWIRVSRSQGTVNADTRIWISVNRAHAPPGHCSGTVIISGAGESVRVHVTAEDGMSPAALSGFMEGDRTVSMEASHWSQNIPGASSRWIEINGYGRTVSGMRATSSPGTAEEIPGINAPTLEYRMYLTDTGSVDVEGIFGPTLNFNPGKGLRYAVSFDDAPPMLVTLVPPGYVAGDGNADWERSVEDNARESHTRHEIRSPGYHTLRFHSVDPGVVLEKIVVNAGGVRPSYLGPPESYFRNLRSGAESR